MKSDRQGKLAGSLCIIMLTERKLIYEFNERFVGASIVVDAPG